MLGRLRVVLAKLVSLVRGSAAEDDALASEVTHHLALLEERYLARGLTPDEARREARRAFGGVPQLAEDHRDARSFAWITQLTQDASYALRMLRRNPGFSSIAMLTLALGIGANTAVFSVVNAAVLRPLPYLAAERLQRIGWNWNDRGSPTAALAPYKFDYLRRHNTVFAALATWRFTSADLGPRGSQGLANMLRVSDDFFGVVGTTPAIGRAFRTEEQRPGGPRVAILTDACWRTRFGAASSAIGRAIVLDDREYDVIGVMPAGFEFPEVSDPPDVLVPLALQPDPQDLGANYSALGRLREGVSPAAAARDVDRVFEQLRAEQPAQFGGPGERAALMSFSEVHLSDVARPLWILLGGVALVLLIACTNVANLLLARATARVREMGVRAALGASHGRLLRQCITEGLVLASIGGALGVATGAAGVRTLMALAPPNISRIDEVRVDGVVISVAVLVVLVTGVLFGVAAAQHGRGHLAARASAGGRGSSVTRSGRRVRQLLLAGQASLAMVLLAGAALLVLSFHRLTQTDLGFDPHGVVVMGFRRVPPEFRSGDRVRAFERDLRARVAALPGVISVASTSVAPLGERGLNIPMTVDGRPDATEGAIEWRVVSQEYADLMGLRLVRGRWLDDVDYQTDRAVVIVNASFAARYWPDADPIGQRIWLGVFRGERRSGTTPIAREIVGIVDDARDLGPTRPLRRTAYLPAIGATGMPSFLVRGTGDISFAALRAAVRDVAPAMPDPTLATLEQRLGERLTRDRFSSVLMGLFAALALVLTAIGVAGVVSWVVRHSIQEIGIRVALGASRTRVLGGVLMRGLLPVAIGLLVGAAGSVIATRAVASLSSVPASPGAWAPLSAAGVMLAAAIVAAYIPARRALGINPVQALRGD